jgi:RNA-binding protein
MTMRGKDRAALRAEAHHLTATVHVGQHGLSDTLVQSLDEALTARELVKVQVSRNAPVDVKAAADSLAGQLGADVVQVIGRTTTLYRHNPHLERKPGGAPPWREA